MNKARNFPPLKFRRQEHDILRELLDRWRGDVGLSQRQLSSKLGRAPNYISRIENGFQGLTVVDVVDIARALKKDPIELFSEYCSLINAHETR
jgi:transcriptional regulator with XRE-family HTH domain